MMKFIYTLFLFFSASVCMVSAHDYAANDAAIRYTGRTKSFADGSVSFDWAGVYLETKFTGGRLDIRLTERGVSYYNVYVDGKKHGVVKSCGTDTLINFVEGVSRGEHALRLQKRSEGEYGRTTFHTFVLPRNGKLSPHPVTRSRFIEFIGNSLTCGFGSEGKDKTEPFKVETENCALSFSNIIARYFNADYALTAHSGRGVVRNYGDTSRCSQVTMREKMLQTFDEEPTEPWDFKNGYRPDLVVINLGTNDFSTEPHPYQTEFVAAYKQILTQLRQNYGNDVPILCLYSCTMGALVYHFYEAVMQVMNDKNIYLLRLRDDLLNQESDLGGAYHPSYQGYKKMAMSMIPFISTITGWGMEHTEIY